MANSRTVTGSRDDLAVDTSRCLRMRYSESGCRRCADICPHRAVTLDGGLSIDPQQCRGCLLCTAVCPVGALEQNNDFTVILAQLSRVSSPVLGCSLTSEQSNATLACLGGLSAEHLLTLSHSLCGELTLNLTDCSGCRNKAIIPHLLQRLAILADRGLLDNGCLIVITEKAAAIRYQDETVDRRSFFKSFRNSLFKSAVEILSTTDIKVEQRSDYAGKRLPLRREYLNSTRSKLSAELKTRIRRHFDSCVDFEDSCSKCLGCAAICPTGALQPDTADSSPTFERPLCTGCGLCSEFCLEGAVRIHSAK